MEKTTGLTLDELETKLAATAVPVTGKGKQKEEAKLRDAVTIYIAHKRNNYTKEHLAKVIGSKRAVTCAIQTVENAIKMADMVKYHNNLTR